jgi:hypothetical protein
MSRSEKGLPVISAETLASIQQVYTAQENWGNHLEEVKQRLVKENPVLRAFIEAQVGQFPETMHNQIFAVIIGTIAVLEHQAEADRLSDLFNLPK